MVHPSQQHPRQSPGQHSPWPHANVSPYYYPMMTTGQHTSHGYFQPGGHPTFFQPQSDVRILGQELVASQRKLLHYTNLISNLCAELEHIRSIVCNHCKERISGANLAQHPSAFASHVPVVPTAPVVSSHVAAGNPVSLPLSSLSAHVFLSPQGNLPDTGPKLQTPSKSIAIIPHPREAPSTESVEEILVKPITKKSQWSVVYNHKTEQVLDISFVHAFKHTSPVVAIRFSPDGRSLAASLLSRVLIYDMETRATTHVPAEYFGYSDKENPSISSICFSPDGRHLAVGNSCKIHIWGIASKRVVTAFKEYKTLRSLDVSPDGRLLATVSFDGSVRIWKMRDGSSKLLGSGGNTMIKFSPNGRYVAASNLDQFLRIWDVRSSKLVGKWNAHEGEAQSLAFSPDAEEVMGGTGLGKMMSWDVGVSTEKCVLVPSKRLVFRRHSEIRSIAVSPDGKWVMTGSADKHICIWNRHTAVQQCTLEGHIDEVMEVDFSPVGNYIATASRDGFITLWTYKMV